MRPTVAQRVSARFDHIRRGVEVRLTHLKMDDVPPLRFERPGAHQHLERRFRAQPIHSLGKFH